MARCGEDKRVVNQIMLRFRPIAPKPVTGGSRSDEALINKSNNEMGSKRRTKRKYVRVDKGEAGKEKMKEIENNNDDDKRVVTLQLLPEIDKSGDYSDGGSRVLQFDSIRDMNNNIQTHEWLSLSNKDYLADPTADPTAVMGGRVDSSWVTVELVAGSCTKAAPPQGFGSICTDEERVMSLEVDTCPGFVSDSWNRVTWLNGAFRRMVTMTWQLPEIAVWLVMKEEEVLPCTTDSSAFTCQVKLMRYAKERCYYSQMVPCDMWGMDGGGFAWRLDVKAALTLAVDAAPLHI